MNANIRCISKACTTLGLQCKSLHSDGNVLQLVGYPDCIFANCSTSINSHALNTICKDKDYTYAMLHEVIAMPETLSFISTYVNEEFASYKRHESIEEMMEVIQKNFTEPLVIKRNSGSWGAHVFMCQSFAQAANALRTVFDVYNKDYDYVALAQQHIDIQTEYRVIVLHGKIAFAYIKQAPSADVMAFKSPLHRDGAKAVLVTDQALLHKLQAFIEPIFTTVPLVYGGLDVALDTDGNFQLIELNSAPAFDIFTRDNGDTQVIALYEAMLKECVR